MSTKQRTCANVKCQTASSPLWRKGWALNDGTKKHAMLCNACGLHYKKGHFCLWCNQIYKEVDADDTNDPWVGCDRCSRWTHKRCEESHGYVFRDHHHHHQEEREAAAADNAPYLCPQCRELKQQLIREQQQQQQQQLINADHADSSSISNLLSSTEHTEAPLPLKKQKHHPRLQNLISAALQTEPASPQSPSELLNSPFSNVSISSPTTAHNPAAAATGSGSSDTTVPFDAALFVKGSHLKKRRRKPQERNRAKIKSKTTLATKMKKKQKPALPQIDTSSSTSSTTARVPQPDHDRVVPHSAGSVQPRFDWDKQAFLAAGPPSATAHYNYSHHHHLQHHRQHLHPQHYYTYRQPGYAAQPPFYQHQHQHHYHPYFNYYHYSPHYNASNVHHGGVDHGAATTQEQQQQQQQHETASASLGDSESEEEQRRKRYQMRRHHSIDVIDANRFHEVYLQQQQQQQQHQINNSSMSKLQSLWAVCEMELKNDSTSTSISTSTGANTVSGSISTKSDISSNKPA